MNWSKLVDYLDLDNHRFFDKDIQAITTIQLYILIYNR